MLQLKPQCFCNFIYLSVNYKIGIFCVEAFLFAASVGPVIIVQDLYDGSAVFDGVI